MADIKVLNKGDDPRRHADRNDRRRSECEGLAETGDRQRTGFSARLNLLCSLAGERELGNGRLEDLVALHKDWDTSRVYGWLCEDQLPAGDELRLLIRFLAARLPTSEDPIHWEAFLVYGPAYVRDPLNTVGGRDSTALMRLAARTFAEIVSDYRIGPDSYRPEEKLRETQDLLKKMDLGADGERLSQGHRLIVAAALFPDAVASSTP